jgi:hypothetical protein
MKQSLWLVIAATVLTGAAQQPADKNAEKAKKACETFAKCVTAKDVPALMKVVDVPWCDNINLDETKLILKSEELKQRLEKLIKGSAQIPPKVVLEFKNVLTYEKALEKFGGGLPAEEKKILDQVLKKTDYMLHVVVKSPEGEILTEFTMQVAFHDGQVRVVGLRN